MIAANDLPKRRQEIELLIANDSMSQAIKRLMDFVRDFSEDQENLKEVIVISSSYTRLDKVERRGTLPFKDVEQERSRLLYQALSLIDGVQQEAGLKMMV